VVEVAFAVWGTGVAALALVLWRLRTLLQRQQSNSPSV
jgi:hypothetical protein